MKIKADTKSVKIIDEEKITSGAYNDITLNVELSKEYNGLTTFATFNNSVTMVVGNMVKLPTLKAGQCKIGIYAIETENDKTILRYSPEPTYITVNYGSYKDGYEENIQTPTPSEAEKIYNLINEAIENGKISNSENITSYSQLTDKPSINGIELNNNSLSELNIQEKLSQKQLENINRNLVAGNNITINNDTISASVPTKTSDLINDSQFLVANDITQKANIDFVNYELSKKQNCLTSKQLEQIDSIDDLQNKTRLIEKTDNHLFEIQNNTIYKILTSIDTLSFNTPSNPNFDFICSIVFSTNNNDVIINTPNKIIWYGDNVVKGIFQPASNTNYELFIWWNGVNWKAIVSGVSNE